MARTASEHTQVVLSAIIPDRRDLLDKAMKHLTPDHFPDQMHKNIFLMLENYVNVTGAVLTRAALSDILTRGGIDAGKAAFYEETYDALVVQAASEEDFHWSLDQVRELAAERATGEVLTTSMQVLSQGFTDPKGRVYQGHQDARSLALQGFAEIDRDLSMQDAPEGTIQSDADKILNDYIAAKKARELGKPLGVYFGVPEVDLKQGGAQNGDLILVAGYSNSGKTAACIQWAWNAAVTQGVNVVYLTTETIRPQVIRKLISRHSRLDLFDLPEGLNSVDLKGGTLPDHLESKFQDVLNDLTRNPSYGKINVVQLPRGATVGVCESRLVRLGRETELGFCVMDYAQLVNPEHRHNSDREALGSVVKGFKQVTTTFYDGRGLPIVSPWQTNRTSWEKAQQSGQYTSSATSETAEATNTPDGILSLLEPQENNSRYATLRYQQLKARDGETTAPVEIEVDYATCFFSGKKRAGSMEDLLDASPTSGGAFG
jgi:replicative DNA helicase